MTLPRMMKSLKPLSIDHSLVVPVVCDLTTTAAGTHLAASTVSQPRVSGQAGTYRGDRRACHALGGPREGCRLGTQGLAGVLFDMDGTLVDSEKVWDVGLTELAERYGGTLSAAARTRMVGTSMAESMSILHGDIGQPWRDNAVSVAWLEERVKELFGDGLVWRPGAAELLPELRAAGVPLALVTTTRRPL